MYRTQEHALSTLKKQEGGTCDWSAMSAEKVRTEVRGAQIKWGFVGCGEHFVSYSEMEDFTSFGQGLG